jgi:hypothetical protein
MPKKNVPSYCLHKPSEQAIVKLNGKYSIGDGTKVKRAEKNMTNSSLNISQAIVNFLTKLPEK